MYFIFRKIFLWSLFSVFIFSIFINFLIWIRAEGKFYSFQNLPKIKYALILGTSKYTSNGKKNKFYYQRIKLAKKLVQEKKVDFLILSGTSEKYYNEVGWMQKDLLKLGIPKKIIILDKKGGRTYSSIANFIKKYPQEKSVILVSQKFHLERAIFLAYIQNPDLEVYAIPADKDDTIYEFKIYLREFASRLKLFFYDLIFKKVFI